tara:strand:- start:31680 stop:32189 length:510 start_codon:yes stop_codon:yes gene_type:complete
MSNTKLRKKHQTFEEQDALYKQREAITTYGWVVLLNWVQQYGVPRLAELSAKGFAYMVKAEKKVANKQHYFLDVDVSVDLLRSMKQLVNDIQEVNEEDGLIMSLPNSNVQVNVMGFTMFFNKFGGVERIISELYSIQPLMAHTVEPDTLADFKEVYDWLEDFRITVCQL